MKGASGGKRRTLEGKRQPGSRTNEERGKPGTFQIPFYTSPQITAHIKSSVHKENLEGEVGEKAKLVEERGGWGGTWEAT